jgi:ribulose-phosphate 3-epimerase
MMTVAASILNCNFLKLEDEIKKVQAAGIDAIHLDVMDGHFVPNLSFGIPLLKAVKPYLSVPIFSHLMVTEPEIMIDKFIPDSDGVIIHIEATAKINECISVIKQANKYAGIALNPETPIDKVEVYLDNIYEVLIMSVYPGFGGQVFIPGSIEKVRRLKELISRKQSSVLIGVDGGVGPNNAKTLIKTGADILIAGTAIFKSDDYAETIRKLKNP